MLRISICFALTLTFTIGAAAEPVVAKKRIAAIVTCYYHNSHADLIVSRLLKTQTLDGQGESLDLELVSLYVDQFPDNDVSRALMAEHGVPILPTIAEALQLGQGRLAVDGVLLIAEHGVYPVSSTGQMQYPKRRMFEEVVRVFERSGRVVPVFIDKHLSDNWSDARWIYDTAARLKIPLMAGSSLPGAYRHPAVDVEDGGKLREIVATSYHTLDAYGFHAVELVQTLAERRAGGETGIRSVQCLAGDEVWKAGESGVYDPALLTAAIGRMERQFASVTEIKERTTEEPTALVIHYTDGLKATILTMNNAFAEWTAAWRYEDGRVESTLFWTQEWRPFVHFAFQLSGIERMMTSGEPAWPVERTLLSSGALEALLISKRDGGAIVQTPRLNVAYQSDWVWQAPPPPPPNRPIEGP